MKNFDVIKSTIDNLALSPEDTLAMTSMFATIPDQALINIRKLIEKDPSWITKMNDNRKKKLKAFSTGDQSLWNEIIAEEKQYIADLTYDLD